jgi:hypothetical protein
MKVERLTLVGVGSLTVLCACSPILAPLPFHLAETAAPLDRGAMRVTVAAGGGAGVVFDGSGGGGALRLRIGVGARQELGFEGMLLGIDNGRRQRGDSDYIGPSTAWATKLSWKLAPRDWFAIVLGAGASHAVTGTAAGGDAALLFSRSRGFVRPYGALRFTFAVPVAASESRSTLGLVAPAGLALALSRSVDLFLEAGGFWLSAEAHHVGGYTGAGLAFTFFP